MNLVFSLKILTDLCFFMFAISSVTSIPAHSGLLATSPFITALAAYFSRFLHEKLPQRAWLRYAPLALCGLCFLFTAHAADVVVTVPMILYVGFVALKKQYGVDYDATLSRFYFCLKLIIVPLLIVVIGNNWAGFVAVMLPYFFFYLVLTVMLLRMLRHNEKVLTDRRFRLMNVAEMLLLCGAGYLLSSGYMLMAFRFLIGLVVRFILRPVLMGVVYVFGGFAWLLNKLFSGIDFHMENVDFSQLDDLGQAVQQGDQTVQQYAQNQDSPAIRIMTYVLIGIGALIVILVVILLFRALMKAGRRDDDNKFEDVRESLDDAGENGGRRLTRAPRDRVRHYYRRFLKLCDVRGIGAGEHLNSREINDKARHIFRTPALAALRELYIKARYSSTEITADDVKEARGAYEEVRKSGD